MHLLGSARSSCDVCVEGTQSFTTHRGHRSDQRQCAPADGISVRDRHLPGGAARAGSTPGRVLVQLDPPSAAQNGRGGGRGERRNSFNGPLASRLLGLLAVWLSTKARVGQHEHAHCARVRTFSRRRRQYHHFCCRGQYHHFRWCKSFAVAYEFLCAEQGQQLLQF